MCSWCRSWPSICLLVSWLVSRTQLFLRIGTGLLCITAASLSGNSIWQTGAPHMWKRVSKYGTATRSEAPCRIHSGHFVMELKQHIVEGWCGSGGRRVGVEAQLQISLGAGSNRCIRWQRKGVVWQQEKEKALNWYTGGGRKGWDSEYCG